MSRSERPALNEPDLANLVGRLPTTSQTDSRFDAAAALEDPDALSKRVREGTVRVLNTDTNRPYEPATQEQGRRRGPEPSLSTKVPDYVMRQLKVRSAERGITIRNLLLLALREAGLEIDDEDIRDERKRR